MLSDAASIQAHEWCWKHLALLQLQSGPLRECLYQKLLHFWEIYSVSTNARIIHIIVIRMMVSLFDWSVPMPTGKQRPLRMCATYLSAPIDSVDENSRRPKYFSLRLHHFTIWFPVCQLRQKSELEGCAWYFYWRRLSTRRGASAQASSKMYTDVRFGDKIEILAYEKICVVRFITHR